MEKHENNFAVIGNYFKGSSRGFRILLSNIQVSLLKNAFA